MSAAMKVTWLAMLASITVACGPQASPHAPDGLGDGPACGALGEVADLSYALAGGTLRGAGDPRHALVRADELLGYLGALDARLASTDRDRRAPLRGRLDRFTTALTNQREQVETQLDALAQSHEAALVALHEAAICQGVDQRDPRKDADEVAASRPGAPPLRPATTHEEQTRRDRIREQNREILGSEACREQVRLWQAASTVDLGSALGPSAVASHIRELRLEPAVAAVRDRLAAALEAHAANLRALERLVDPEASGSSSAARELSSAGFELATDLDASMTSCLETLPPTDRVRSRGAEPRVATVVVRPRYPEAVESLMGDLGSFGSGFVVQWQTRDGRRRTRIITNAHVMQGVSTAEIRPSDAPDAPSSSAREDQPPPLEAQLVRSLSYDDIAVLELEDSERARALFGEGLRLRHDAVHEQEPIVAAGFPGVGGTPSYQISEGVISNARFGSYDSDPSGVTGYIQHTAPIDPGNSGGPLLDRRGRVIGMNTLKIWGRENMGLAIPVPRIQFAMLRADEPLRFEVEHARAACNLVVAALGAERPEIGALHRLGLSLYEPLEATMGRTEAVDHRERVQGMPMSEADLARVRIYGALRSGLEDERGVGSYARCEEVSRIDGEPEGPRFQATFRTRTRELRMILAEEDGQLRVVEIEAREQAATSFR